MKQLAIFASLLLLSPCGGAMAADSVAISKRDCARLVQHTPGADVAYKPGVDTRGRKVVGADLDGGSQIALPDEISIDIGFDLAGKYGVPATGGAYSAESSSMGKVTFKGGRAYFNDKPISSADQQALSEACQRKGIR